MKVMWMSAWGKGRGMTVRHSNSVKWGPVLSMSNKLETSVCSCLHLECHPLSFVFTVTVVTNHGQEELRVDRVNGVSPRSWRVEASELDNMNCHVDSVCPNAPRPNSYDLTPKPKGKNPYCDESTRMVFHGVRVICCHAPCLQSVNWVSTNSQKTVPSDQHLLLLRVRVPTSFTHCDTYNIIVIHTWIWYHET